jgi:hypothetical protein
MTTPTDQDVIAAIAEQINADLDKHLFGRRARVFLQQKLRRLEQVYGVKAVKAGLRLQRREAAEQYRARLCAVSRERRERERHQKSKSGVKVKLYD